MIYKLILVIAAWLAIAIPANSENTTVARVVLVQGNISAQQGDAKRVLARNSSLYNGDLLTSENHATAQILFLDGGIITLNANTEFKITEFTWNGAEDGSEKAFFELVKGGFRAASGKIGHKNPESYLVHTPQADVGINGTYYGLLLCSAGSCIDTETSGRPLANGLYGGALSGSINTTNTTGTQEHSENTFFVVTETNSAPENVLIPPPIFHGDSTTIGDSSEITSSDSNQNTVQVSVITAGSGGTGTGGAGGTGNQPPADPVITDNDTVKADLNTQTAAPDTSKLLMSYTRSTGANHIGAVDQISQTSSPTDAISLLNGDVAGGYSGTHVVSLNNVLSGSAQSLTDTGSNLTYGAHWGVWNGEYLLLDGETQLNHNDALSYIYSDSLTSITTLSNLGGIDSKLNIYSLLSGTLPVTNSGIIDNELPAILSTVDFVSQQLTDYAIHITDINGRTYFANLNAPVAFANLNQSFSLNEPNTSCAGTLASCAGLANLAFVGSQGTGIITSYTLFDASTTSTGSISGSALLGQISGNGITSASNNSGLLYAYGGYNNNGSRASITGEVTTQTGSNAAFYLNATGAPIASAIPGTTMAVNTTASTLADTGSVTTVLGEANNVQWGRWQGQTQFSYPDKLEYAVRQVFYITADNLTPATTLTNLGGILGTQNYNTVAGTAFVDLNGNTFGNSSVSMTTDFVSQNITAYNLTGGFGVNTFDLGLTGGTPVAFNNINQGLSLASTSSPCAAGNSCTGTARLQFIGTSAQGAITSWTFTNGIDTASGTALLTH